MSDEEPQEEARAERRARIRRFLEMSDREQKYVLLIFDWFSGPVQAICEEMINDAYDAQDARREGRRKQQERVGRRARVGTEGQEQEGR